MELRNEWPVVVEERHTRNGADCEPLVNVIFTTVEPTVEALKHANLLTRRFNTPISLVVPQVVPYPLPLTQPPVPAPILEERFGRIARRSGVETVVSILLCRDRREALLSLLKPHSLVVLGGRKRWWPSPEKRLAQSLRRAGHEVVITETE